jgi:hypothetical protein
VPWPSGKARVCKTLIPRFKSGRHLRKSDGLAPQVHTIILSPSRMNRQALPWLLRYTWLVCILDLASQQKNGPNIRSVTR